MAAAFSPIMIDGALVLPEVMRGITEASAARRLSMRAGCLATIIGQPAGAIRRRVSSAHPDLPAWARRSIAPKLESAWTSTT